MTPSSPIPPDMLSLDTFCIAPSEEPLKAFMLETLITSHSVIPQFAFSNFNHYMRR